MPTLTESSLGKQPVIDKPIRRSSRCQRFPALSCAICIILGSPLAVLDIATDRLAATEPATRTAIGNERLAHLDSVNRDDLDAVTSVVISADGRYLYAAAYQGATHVVFSRNAKTGGLTHVQTVQSVPHLTGTTSLRLSPNERFAVAAAFQSRSVTLYARDIQSGMLSLLDCKQQGVDAGVSGLDFTIEAQFSPDGKFVYALDDQGGVTSFRLAGKDDALKLEFVEAFRSNDLLGARGLAHHPSGEYLFVACKISNTLVALRRDATSGKLSIVDVARDDTDDVMGLQSAFGVDISDDGKFVYYVSGQHGRGKDNSVGVFRFDADKEELSIVQEVLPGEIELNGRLTRFNGGNEITIDPAQRRVYASATGSASLAVFDRDTETGEVTLVQMISDQKILGWVSGLAVSPDGRFVYAAAEKIDSICIFGPASLANSSKQASVPRAVDLGLQFDADLFQRAFAYK